MGVASGPQTRFYHLAGRVLTRDDAFVEFVGDQVMAFYLPDFPSLREGTPEVMVTDAHHFPSARL